VQRDDSRMLRTAARAHELSRVPDGCLNHEETTKWAPRAAGLNHPRMSRVPFGCLKDEEAAI